MEEGATGSAARLLFCPICGKPFGQESSHTRHVQYCRRRAASRRPVRTRACHACRASKLKCDAQMPCSRCVKRQVPCHYDQVQGSRAIEGPVATAADPLLVNEDTQRNDEYAALPVAEMPELALSPTFTSLLASPFSPILRMPSPSSSMPVLALTTSTAMTTMAATAGTATSTETATPTEAATTTTSGSSSNSNSNSATASAASTVSNTNSIHSPDDGTRICRAQLNMTSYLRRLIVAMLRTFPRMMTRPEALPPFVHHIGCGLHFTEGTVEEARRLPVSFSNPAQPDFSPLPPLAACVGLSHAFASRTAHSDDFLWRAIESEHQKILGTMYSYTPGLVLAALQAMTIYTAMRFMTYGCDYFARDMSMIDTMNKLAELYCSLCPGPFSPGVCCVLEQRPSWEEWISAETRRRIAVSCWIMSIVVSPGGGLGGSLGRPHFFPLPNSRRLWEASTRDDWMRIYEEERLLCRTMLRGNHPYPLLTVGDLADVLADAGTNGDDASADDALARWHAHMDGLGMVLTAVVTHHTAAM